jgi:hypothetical protein
VSTAAGDDFLKIAAETSNRGLPGVDVLDRVHFELRDGEVSLARRRALLDEAIAANDQLVGRLDDTLSRIGAPWDERAAIAVRLREKRDELYTIS